MAGKDRTIKTKLVLDGEKEYRQQLAEITSGLKENASQTALLTAQYAENADSTEALAAKGAALHERLDLQQQKIAAMSPMLDKAKEAQERATQAVDKAAQEVDKQRAALEKLESAENSSAEAIKKQSEAVAFAEAALKAKKAALSDTSVAVNQYQKDLNYAQKDILATTQAMEGSGKEAQNLGQKITGLAENMGVQLPAGISTAIEALNGGTVATAAWAAAAGGMLTMLVKSTKETTKYVDDLVTMSTVTGISAETLQEWNYAAGLMDIDISTVNGSIAKMTRTMSSAQSGTASSKAAFDKLGVGVTGVDGKLRKAEDVFWDSIEALGKMKNETERDALSMELFGRSAKDLNTVIEAGREGFEGFSQEAHEMGYVMDQDTLDRFNKLADEMDRFDNVQQTVKQNMAEALLPILTALLEILAKIDPKVIATVAVIGTVATVTVAVVKAINTAISTFKEFSETTGKLKDAMKDLGEKGEAGIGKVVSGLGGIPLAAGVAATAVLGIATAIGQAELEAARLEQRMAISLGLTEEEAARHAETIKEVFDSGMAKSQEQVETAATAALRVLGATDETLKDITEHIIQLNDAGAGTTEGVAAADAAMKNFGLTTDEAFDLVLVGLQSSANKSGDFLSAFNKYAPAYAQLGLTHEEALSKMIAATDAGAYSADAASAAYIGLFKKAAEGGEEFTGALRSIGLDSRQITSDLVAGGDRGQQAAEKITRALENTTDKVKLSKAATALFGSQWEAIGTPALAAMATVQQSIAAVDGASEKYMEKSRSNIDAFLRYIQRNLFEDWGIANLVIPGFGGVVGGIKKVNRSIRGYADGTDFHPGGWAMVGERGAELVNLPRGARVLNHAQTETMINAPRYAEGIGNFGETTVIIEEHNEFKVDSLEDYIAIKEYHRQRQLSRRKGFQR